MGIPRLRISIMRRPTIWARLGHSTRCPATRQPPPRTQRRGGRGAANCSGRCRHRQPPPRTQRRGGGTSQPLQPPPRRLRHLGGAAAHTPFDGDAHGWRRSRTRGRRGGAHRRRKAVPVARAGGAARHSGEPTQGAGDQLVLAGTTFWADFVRHNRSATTEARALSTALILRFSPGGGVTQVRCRAVSVQVRGVVPTQDDGLGQRMLVAQDTQGCRGQGEVAAVPGG